VRALKPTTFQTQQTDRSQTCVSERRTEQKEDDVVPYSFFALQGLDNNLNLNNTMNKLLSISALLFSATADAASPFNSTLTASGRIDTVDELNVDSYLGYWYTVYTNKITDTITFKGGKCATATYTLREDGNIGVFNYETIGEAVDGSTGTDTIEGYAYVTDPSEPGQLMVVLDGIPTPAPYWVAALGPVNADKLYDYSLVSDNTGSFLFVLARDVDDFKSKYDEEVQSLMKDLGFTGSFKAPYSMYQGSDCLYGA
jgi:lipocalin